MIQALLSINQPLYGGQKRENEAKKPKIYHMVHNIHILRKMVSLPQVTSSLGSPESGTFRLERDLVSVTGLFPGDLLTGFPRLPAGWYSFPDSSLPDGLS